MRSCVVSVVILGACGFRSPGGVPGDTLPPDGATADASGPMDADPSMPAFCDPTDPHLMVCYEFEGDGHDGSSHHLDADATHVSFPDGQVGKAMQFAADSTANVPDSAVFDVANLTIEAWIRPAQLPSSGRAGIADMEGQYGFFLFSGPQLSCILINGPTVNAAPISIAVDHWSHVACTYNGTTSVIYVDGVVRGQASGSGVLATGGNSGLSIAANNPSGTSDRLIGLIDQLRMMNIARSAAEICADAGKSSCL